VAGCCEYGNERFGSLNCWDLLVSQEGLGCMKLVLELVL
jgi:hypothetical protein